MRPTIDFFGEESKTHSNKSVFGICDDDNTLPAYLDEDLSNKDSKWIGVINNVSQKEIGFYPVDHCVVLKRKDGSDAQRCEGILRHNNNIVFTELKNRDASWLSKAMEQVIETMSFFYDNYDSQSYQTKARICNKQLTNQNYFQQITEFKEMTKVFCHKNRGFVLYIRKSIDL